MFHFYITTKKVRRSYRIGLKWFKYDSQNKRKFYLSSRCSHLVNIEKFLHHTSMSHSIKNNATQKNALDKNCSSSAWRVPGSAKIKRIVTGWIIKLFQEAKKRVLKHNSFVPIIHNLPKRSHTLHVTEGKVARFL